MNALEQVRYNPESGFVWWIQAGEGRKMNLPAARMDAASGRLVVDIDGEAFPASSIAHLAATGSLPGDNLSQVLYKDGNPWNNRFDNLEFVYPLPSIPIGPWINPFRNLINPAGFRDAGRGIGSVFMMLIAAIMLVLPLGAAFALLMASGLLTAGLIGVIASAIILPFAFFIGCGFSKVVLEA
ncbi:hypothetical protein [Aureimonas altamirensis]|uniref:hypothetical protein n=1 Tax=Aureimonas altamirensis TaxID=370622 RepID=UPI0025528693|nr:hypothetical protein [Aureimonas altamirensis]